MTKLTPKRRHFARLVASGQSQADAYREAFDCKPGSLSQTHVESASKLARDPLVSTTIRQLIDARDRAERDRGLTKRDLVISKLSEAIENDDFGVNRLKALSLMADVLGMKRSGIDVAQADTRSSETILAELRAKLESLTELGLIDAAIDHDADMDSDAIIDSAAGNDPIRH